MDLRQIEVFVEIARSGGFNRAAARLHIAQSALSRRVKQLERELGTVLFARHGRGVRLTPAGTLLVERAEDILRRLRQVRDEVSAEANVARGELALGLPPSLAAFGTRLLLDLRASAPQLHVRTWVATSVVLRDMLLNNRVDIAIFGVVEPEPILHTEALFRDRMDLVGPPGALCGEATSWAQISALPLALTSLPNSVRQVIEAAAQRSGRRLNVVTEINDVPLLLGLVKAGAVYTVLPRSASEFAVRSGDVGVSPIEGLAFEWVVAFSKEQPLTAGGRQALALILELAREIGPEGAGCGGIIQAAR